MVAELGAIGISAAEQKKRNITFHSLRHTFISHARASNIGDIQTQALAGQKSAGTTEKYTHRGQVVEVNECGKVLEGYYRTT
jgi:integrase